MMSFMLWKYLTLKIIESVTERIIDITNFMNSFLDSLYRNLAGDDFKYLIQNVSGYLLVLIK